MDRGLSNETPPLTGRQPDGDRPGTAEPTDGGEGRRRATDRHARSDNDGAQISVQELLRRSRSGNGRSES